MDEFKKQVAQEMGGDLTSGYVDGHMIKHRASERIMLFAGKSRIYADILKKSGIYSSLRINQKHARPKLGMHL